MALKDKESGLRCLCCLNSLKKRNMDGRIRKFLTEYLLELIREKSVIKEYVMNIDSIFARMRELLHNGAGAKFSFGNPVSVGDLSILPVARVVFGFGGGGGKSPAKKKKQQDDTDDTVATEANENFGGGGGGGIKTEPVGIYTIKGDKVKFYPIVSVREVLAIFGVVILLLLKIRRLKRKIK